MKRPVALQAVLDGPLGADLRWRPQPALEWLPTGIAALDALTGGLPRGCITEIAGPASSGRTSILHAVLARATADGESCVLVDAGDAFDPESAVSAGVDLSRLLWVRCGGNAEHALRVTDLLLQSGGFGLVAMDLGDIPPQTARRISLTSWYRFRRAVEPVRTVFLVIGLEPYARQCATLSLEAHRERIEWSGTPGCSRLLDGVRVSLERRKPAGTATAAQADFRWKQGA